MKLSTTVFLGLFLYVFNVYAQDGVVRIPLKTFIKPASNLVSQTGKELSFAEITKLHKQSFDLSTLQPTEDKYWQNKKYSAVETALHKSMPSLHESIEYDSDMGGNRELGFYSIIVKPGSGKSERYILTLGLEVHASLLKSALLRKLGYYQESPRYYNKVKLTFSSKEQKEKFVKTAFCEEGPSEEAVDCLSLVPFKTEENKREFLSDAGEKALYVHGAYLEKMDSEVPSLFDGLTPAYGDLVPYFSQSRQFRALIVPFMIGDVQESVNRFSTQSVMVRAGWAYLNYPFSGYFQETSADDVRWLLRRVAQLSDQDWTEIVDAAMYPESLKQLIKAKLLYRTRNMINTFFSVNESRNLFNVQIPELKYTSNDGYVKDGRVTTEYIPGYPQRFSHGERKSPFESGDLVRYMIIKSQSSLMGVATSRLNEKLNKTKIDDVKTDGVRLGPKGYVPVGSATGHQFGINFSVNRIVTTGTFYGSQAAVQLVDNVNFSVGLGMFRVAEDFYGFRSNVGANLAYTRDFTHVRPLESMKETKEIPYKDVLVASKLEKLAEPLKSGKVSEFIQSLKAGEVFTITESVGVAGTLGTGTSIDNLIGFTAKTVPFLGLSGGASRVILRQTQITKTAEGIQIFVRNQNGKAFNVAFDVNYYLNLLKIKNETVLTDLHTDAFILNYNGDFVVQVEKTLETVKEQAKKDEQDPEEAVNAYFAENPDIKKSYDKQKSFGEKMAAALRGIVFQSNTDQLYGYFKGQRFAIDHWLKTNEIKTKLLWFRSSELEEEHLLKVYKPQINVAVSGTVQNKPIEIVTYRKGEMTGRDYLGFGLNILDYQLARRFEKNAPSLSQDSQNPSQMPFGRAQWHIVRTDTELTQDREGALPSVGLIQNVWGGWSLSKKNLESILAQVTEKFKGTEFENQEVIPAEVFYQVKKIDFFRITENLALLPGALDRIKDLVITPDATGLHVDKAKFLSGLFQKLSQIGKNNKARPEDKAIFRNVMTLIGNGDEEKGRAQYEQQCRENAQAKSDGEYVNTTVWKNGISYTCLDSWLSKIISLARKFVRSDLREQNKLMTEIIYELEKNIPLHVLLKAIGEENYLYFVEVTGFRTGDEDGDQGLWVSNVLGEPAKKHPYSNGLINVIAESSKIIPIELDRSQGSFQ